MSFKYKQVIVVRTDLAMRPGKIAAQVAHAAVTCVELARKEKPDWLKAWLDEGQCKIVLKVPSLDELLQLKEKAQSLGLPCCLIVDRGLTEIPPNTVTCLGIGPAPSELIDKVTGHLPLLR